MLTHVMLGANDPAKSIAFYDAALGALGIESVHMGDRAFYRSNEVGPAFSVGRPTNGKPATFANGGTVGFAAPNMAAVDAFHAAGIAAGGVDEGGPGHRPTGPGKTYAAYLRDPDGNKLCANCQMPD